MKDIKIKRKLLGVPSTYGNGCNWIEEEVEIFDFIIRDIRDVSDYQFSYAGFLCRSFYSKPWFALT